MALWGAIVHVKEVSSRMQNVMLKEYLLHYRWEEVARPVQEVPQRLTRHVPLVPELCTKLWLPCRPTIA